VALVTAVARAVFWRAAVAAGVLSNKIFFKIRKVELSARRIVEHIFAGVHVVTNGDRDRVSVGTGASRLLVDDRVRDVA
jgi:hypothetical protein